MDLPFCFCSSCLLWYSICIDNAKAVSKLCICMWLCACICVSCSFVCDELVQFITGLQIPRKYINMCIKRQCSGSQIRWCLIVVWCPRVARRWTCLGISPWNLRENMTNYIFLNYMIIYIYIYMYIYLLLPKISFYCAIFLHYKLWSWQLTHFPHQLCEMKKWDIWICI